MTQFCRAVLLSQWIEPDFLAFVALASDLFTFVGDIGPVLHNSVNSAGAAVGAWAKDGPEVRKSTAGAIAAN